MLHARQCYSSETGSGSCLAAMVNPQSYASLVHAFASDKQLQAEKNAKKIQKNAVATKPISQCVFSLMTNPAVYWIRGRRVPAANRGWCVGAWFDPAE